MNKSPQNVSVFFYYNDKQHLGEICSASLNIESLIELLRSAFLVTFFM
jgi:hypothetical protein